MDDKRTIKIFLASSEELENDRNAFGNLVRRLDKIYEKRGVRIELFEWEDYDAAYNDCRKQDEYNDQVRASDMFLALFHIKAGKYTIEEFDVATKEFQRTKRSPKSYVYLRDLQEGEKETIELTEFKRRLFDEMGHYWSRYNNKDSLQLHFVMQLQLVENCRMEELKVENGVVKLGDENIARMDNLRFASENKDYLRMSNRLLELPKLIEKAKLRTDKYPDDKDLQDELQKLKDERNELQEKYKKQQEFLLKTAKRIAQLQGEQITDRMRRAMDAFEEGNVREANIILDEAEKDGDDRFAEFEIKEELRNKEIINIHRDIECLLLQSTSVMADVAIPIQERIDKAFECYKKADHRASIINYDEEKYLMLLDDYSDFLVSFGPNGKAIEICQRAIYISEKLYGIESVKTASFYNHIVLPYHNQGDYGTALEYALKNLKIIEQVYGEQHIDVADCYNNIATVYDFLGKQKTSLMYLFKAINIIRKISNDQNDPFLACCYHNVGLSYYHMGAAVEALDYFFKAYKIYSKQPVDDYLNMIACNFDDIGMVYEETLFQYDNALFYRLKALEIFKDIFGNDRNTATCSSNIGLIYVKLGDYGSALRYSSEALSIYRLLNQKYPHDVYESDVSIQSEHVERIKELLKEDVTNKPTHTDVVQAALLGDHTAQFTLGSHYHYGDSTHKSWTKALYWFEKSAEQGNDEAKEFLHVNMYSYHKGVDAYMNQDYNAAIDCFNKALSMSNTTDFSDSVNNYYLAIAYEARGDKNNDKNDYERSIRYLNRALNLFVQHLGKNELDTANCYEHIGSVSFKQCRKNEALNNLSKALSIKEKILGPEHDETLELKKIIEAVSRE